MHIETFQKEKKLMEDRFELDKHLYICQSSVKLNKDETKKAVNEQYLADAQKRVDDNERDTEVYRAARRERQAWRAKFPKCFWCVPLKGN